MLHIAADRTEVLKRNSWQAQICSDAHNSVAGPDSNLADGIEWDALHPVHKLRDHPYRVDADSRQTKHGC